MIVTVTASAPHSPAACNALSFQNSSILLLFERLIPPPVFAGSLLVNLDFRLSRPHFFSPPSISPSSRNKRSQVQTARSCLNIQSRQKWQFISWLIVRTWPTLAAFSGPFPRHLMVFIRTWQSSWRWLSCLFESQWFVCASVQNMVFGVGWERHVTNVSHVNKWSVTVTYHRQLKLPALLRFQV